MNTLIKALGLSLCVMLAGCISQATHGVANMSKPLISIAVLKAKPGQEQALKAGLLALVEPTRTEPGNLDYVLFELRDEPGTFYMREAFKDQAALDAHFAMPYFQRFAATADDLLREPLKLIFLEQVSN
ncbi:NADPH:quinone reductase [Pseudomonas fluorescens]|uniref:NADPH:quinone reductase n=2 Tax=Pseudomonas fluorescens TaxID=294 RepID=A0A379ICP9_PSEFL|nr:NADPH:quinone reductase [Pseudomonas fluorescens]